MFVLHPSSKHFSSEITETFLVVNFSIFRLEIDIFYFSKKSKNSRIANKFQSWTSSEPSICETKKLWWSKIFRFSISKTIFFEFVSSNIKKPLNCWNLLLVNFNGKNKRNQFYFGSKSHKFRTLKQFFYFFKVKATSSKST